MDFLKKALQQIDDAENATEGMPDCTAEQAFYDTACDVVDAAILVKADAEADLWGCQSGM